MVANINACGQDGTVAGPVLTKKITLDPNDNLIIQLVRFSFDPTTGMPSKVTTEIEINKELIINKKKYKIQGVVVHIGADTNSGHYYYVRYDNGEPTFVISDSTIEPIIEETKETIKENAYILLYKKVNDDSSYKKYLKYKKKYLSFIKFFIKNKEPI
jgi:ubiquitin C-terminal hydrolase